MGRSSDPSGRSPRCSAEPTTRSRISTRRGSAAPRVPGRHLGHPHRCRRGGRAAATRHRRGSARRRAAAAGRGRCEPAQRMGRDRRSRRRAHRRTRPRRRARRAHASRGRGRATRRAGQDQPRDGRAVRALRAHRRDPRAAHPHEARIHIPFGDRRVGGALLQFLAGHVDTMGLVVVATYRDADPTGDGFAEVLAQLVRERNTTRLRLGGLDADGVAEVIGAAVGVGPTPRLVARVRELTDGNPLYVGEAARLLASEGRLDDTIESDRLLIPRDIRETVLRRLGQLSEQCQRVLELASVLGRDFPLDVLGEARGRRRRYRHRGRRGCLCRDRRRQPGASGPPPVRARRHVGGALSRDPGAAAAPTARRGRTRAGGLAWTRPRSSPR